MSEIAWELTHSEETDASLAFAWNYWANVANWDDPPAKFELHGPFVAGSHGTTRLPEQEPFDWLIAEVDPPNGATIELQLDRAVLSFQWGFAALTDQQTRLTQRVVLRGENAAMFRAQVASTFTINVPQAMKKLARAIAVADANRR